MAEENKNDEKIRVNVIKKAVQPAPQPQKSAESETEVEKKHIILKKKPTIVVKVKEKEEEKTEAPKNNEERPLSESGARTPKVIPYDKSKLPPINPEPKKPQNAVKQAEPEKKDSQHKENVILTGKSFMTNTAVHHQNSRIQSPLHNGPVIIKSADLPPVPGQKVEGSSSPEAPHKPRVAGVVGGRPAGGTRQQNGLKRFQNGRPQSGFQRQGQGQRMPRPGQSYTIEGGADVYTTATQEQHYNNDQNSKDLYVYNNNEGKMCFYSYSNVRVTMSGKLEDIAGETGQSNIEIEVEPGFEKVHNIPLN